MVIDNDKTVAADGRDSVPEKMRPKKSKSEKGKISRGKKQKKAAKKGEKVYPTRSPLDEPL